MLLRMKIVFRQYIFSHRGPLCALLRRIYTALLRVHSGAGRRYAPRSLGGLHPDKTIYLIKTGGGQGGLFFYFNDIFSRIAAADRLGLVPVVDMRGSWLADDPTDNVWEYYYEQPCGISAEEAEQSANVVLSTDFAPVYNPPMLNPIFLTDDKTLAEHRRLIEKYMRLNASTKEKLKHDMSRLIPAGASVLAVMTRGTDYRRLRPRDHSIQPEPREMIARAQDLMQSRKIDRVFLATEEKSTLDLFREEFGERLLVYDNDSYCDGYSTGAYDNKMLAEYINEREKITISIYFLLHICEIYIRLRAATIFWPVSTKGC